MPTFTRDGVTLNYQETGGGLPFIFQHGLGADVTQPFGLFKPPAGIRLIGFDARGHGASQSGPIEQITLRAFADDLRALLDELQIKKAIVGGISMGAAIALNFVTRYPERVSGLVLSRPAWVDGPNPFNVQMFGLVANLINTVGPDEGLRLFLQSSEFAELRREFPDTAASFSNQFRAPRAREMAATLNRLPADSPIANLSQLHEIRVPTLILANDLDPIHPFDYGVRLAAEIPHAEFREIPSKSRDLPGHLAAVQSNIEDFLTRYFL
jgi:pimeloyl-ACP methyl ester carboxylesterase